MGKDLTNLQKTETLLVNTVKVIAMKSWGPDILLKWSVKLIATMEYIFYPSYPSWHGSKGCLKGIPQSCIHCRADKTKCISL